MTNLLQNAIAYTKTDDYYHGIIVDLTGTVIEVALLSITIPTVIWLFHKFRTKRARAIVDFYLFQIFHKVTSVFLEMVSIDDVCRFAGVSGESHFIYGNLENKFSALKKIFETRDFFKKHVEKKTADDFQQYLKTCEKSLDELDRIIAMSGLIVMFSDTLNVQETAFAFRLRMFVLRDLTENILKDFRRYDANDPRRHFHTYELEKFTRDFVKEIETIFQQRKKLVDSIIKRDQIRSTIILVATLPYILARRWISIRMCRWRNVPYEDLEYPSYAAFLLKEWRSKHGFSLDEAATILEISKKEFRDVEYGYRQPNLDHWERVVKKHLRGEVDYAKSK